MSELTTTTTETGSAMPPAVVPNEMPDICVYARDPQQMNAAQAQLVVWAKAKVEEARGEHADLQENVDIARKNNWGTSALIRARNKAHKGLTFYEKILAALEAGYCLVPNFPMDIFVVRTTKGHPEGWSSTPYRNDVPSFQQQSNSPPLGEGENVGDLPEVRRREVVDRETGKSHFEFRAAEFKDAIFPFVTAKPQILEATAHAQAAKIFDAIGAVGPPKIIKKGDPIIAGRIYDGRVKRERWNDGKFVTFLIAWWVDTRDL